MKKICMLLVLLSGVAFAVNLENKEDVCKKQDLGGCETLYICPNNVSLIVKQEAYKKGGGCNDEIISKYLIDTKEQKLTEIPSKK
ncbi:hypothetical protein [Sulfurospirillum cavolei]|uniref:hypothetical protein n=1 Tax=Sulfurospirillum cavolei TaxID=366522 RepID=UPI003FA1BE3F